MVASTERLIERWETPEGREVLRRVLADLHREGGLNIPAILEGLEFTGEVPDSLDLRFAPLESQQLDEVNLYAVDLTGAVLSGSSMQRADVRDALLPGANLEGVDLSGAYLSNSDLTGVNLKGARLDGAMLDGANLTGATLYGASCRDAYFAGATLDGADLRQAVLIEADFTDASTHGATVTAGAVHRAAVAPPDPSSLVVEAPPQPRRGRSGVHRRPTGAFQRSRIRPQPEVRPGPPRSGPQRRPSEARPRTAGRYGTPPTNGVARDWDQALARLIPLRRSVSRISVWIDGEEHVLYDAPGDE